MAPPLEPHLNLEKDDRELQVRPARLTDFVGQREIAENLSAYLKAALVRREPLDFVQFNYSATSTEAVFRP